jgi:hypothetical protein
MSEPELRHEIQLYKEKMRKAEMNGILNEYDVYQSKVFLSFFCLLSNFRQQLLYFDKRHIHLKYHSSQLFSFSLYKVLNEYDVYQSKVIVAESYLVDRKKIEIGKIYKLTDGSLNPHAKIPFNLSTLKY